MKQFKWKKNIVSSLFTSHKPPHLLTYVVYASASTAGVGASGELAGQTLRNGSYPEHLHHNTMFCHPKPHQ